MILASFLFWQSASAQCRAYVPNSNTTTVTPVNITSHSPLANVTAGTNPFGVVFDPDGSRVFITNMGSDNVTVINTVTNAVITTLTVGDDPRGIAITPDGQKLYVVNFGSDNVSVFNAQTYMPITSVGVGDEPFGIAISPDGIRAYVTNSNNADVTEITIATDAVVGPDIAVGNNPRGIVFSTDGLRAFVTNSGPDNVGIISAMSRTQTSTINVGDNPRAINITPDGMWLYVSNSGTNNVSVINTVTNMVTGTVNVGTTPRGVGMSPNGNFVYIANEGSDNVSVIRTSDNTVTHTVAAGDGPWGLGNMIGPNNGPVIDFPTKDTISCITPPAMYPMLTPSNVLDCDQPVTVMLQSTTPTRFTPCMGTLVSRLERVWKITDGLGNMTIYKDTLCLEKVDIALVVFPLDTAVSCANLPMDTTEAKIGSPNVGGDPITNDPNCNLWVFRSQETILVDCPGHFKLRRIWTVLDDCNTSLMRQDTQIITVIDTIKPVLVVPSALVRNVKANVCEADVQFPMPTTLSDMCTPTGSIQLTIQWVPGGTGPAPTNPLAVNRWIYGLKPGTHIIEYQAWDGCNGPGNLNNIMKDSLILDVIDTVPPVALCRANPVSIQFNDGQSEATLTATHFNDGSYDVCGGPIFYKVRRMTASAACPTPGNPNNWWGDNIKFCCSDVGAPVMVQLGVFQGDYVPGLISPAIASHFSICMASVVVLDKAPPVLVCPDTVQMNCTDDLFNLTGLTFPTIMDNCGLADTIIRTRYSLNDCKVGFIYRDYVVIDPSGNRDSCTQVIKVNAVVLLPGDIIWPADTTLYGCAAPTDTSVTGAPILLKQGCGLVGMTYTDEPFQYITGACAKILRTWKVLDWCNYKGDVNPPQGIFQRVQVIKIKDSIPPVFTGIDDLRFSSTDSMCNPVNLTIEPFNADDCTPDNKLLWRYYIDYHKDGSINAQGLGNNISGSYPVGIHSVRLVVEDRCGNFNDTTFMLELVDAKPPTPVYEALIASLMPVNDTTGMLTVPARFYNEASFDNCTPANQLKFSYSVDMNDSLRTYDCDDVGLITDTVYVWDASGNYNFATVTLDLQDNAVNCPNSLVNNNENRTDISGLIRTESGKGVDEVSVQIIQDERVTPLITDLYGRYKYDKASMHKDYEIQPLKGSDPLNGITTLDIVLITKHILGVQTFESPFQMLAADVDRNGLINSNDVVELRKVLLNYQQNFKDNQSWIFIDRTYQFPESLNPWKEALPSTYQVRDLSNTMKVDFTGIKKGDVNQSVVVGYVRDLEKRQLAEHQLLIADQILQPGQVYDLPLALAPGTDIYGFQFGLTWNRDLVSVESVKSDAWLSNDFVNHRFVGQGRLLVSYVHGSGIKVDHSQNLLVLRVVPEKVISTRELFSLNTSLQPELYHQQETKQLVLDYFQTNLDQLAMRLLPNVPNPFSQATTLRYELTETGPIRLQVYALDGRQVFSRQLDGMKGYNEYSVKHSDLGANGTYVYTVQSGGHMLYGKMLLSR